MVLIIIFGNIFGGNGGTRGKASLILVNESNSIVAKLFEAKLDSSKALYPVKKYIAENGRDSIKFDEATAKAMGSAQRAEAAATAADLAAQRTEKMFELGQKK